MTPSDALPHLTASLEAGAEDRAEWVLRAYFTDLSGKNVGFTGGRWDTFDPSGRREASTNVFTADDLVACSLLSTPISGRAAMELLCRQADHFSRLLEALGPDRDLADEDDIDGLHEATELYEALRGLQGIGPTRASKLLARKRPRLIPIIDAVVKRHAFPGLSRRWRPLQKLLQENERDLHHRLLGLRESAGIGDHVSALRVFDVLTWMDGSGNSRRVLSGLPPREPELLQSPHED
ncbi:DUF6308 family protein [Mariniluteicoccus flavus]